MNDIAKQFRVGNLVRYRNVPQIKPERAGQYRELTADDILYLSEMGCEPIPIEPVDIEEEILFSLGFERDHKLEELEGMTMIQYKIGDQTSSSFFRICYHEEGKYTFSFRGTPLVKVSHAHHLQNLYFVLSGAELKFVAKGTEIKKSFAVRLAEWESTFSCQICKTTGRKNFEYDKSSEAGDLWRCDNCSNKLLVGQEPKRPWQ